eukprot:1191487-Prorocentrum_minimum.AAC.1
MSRHWACPLGVRYCYVALLGTPPCHSAVTVMSRCPRVLPVVGPLTTPQLLLCHAAGHAPSASVTVMSRRRACPLGVRYCYVTPPGLPPRRPLLLCHAAGHAPSPSVTVMSRRRARPLGVLDCYVTPPSMPPRRPLLLCHAAGHAPSATVTVMSRRRACPLS